jgi:hypothetical protein
VKQLLVAMALVVVVAHKRLAALVGLIIVVPLVRVVKGYIEALGMVVLVAVAGTVAEELTPIVLVTMIKAVVAALVMYIHQPRQLTILQDVCLILFIT